ncbi:hypothetical protein DFP72DRAFT_1145865 [Ephemerocybe angulata]|uniref:Uncharacterized protein n=1 Tax=Ephemerocybe angulata TaxID=980116 RepID=A0A8H6HMP4_9AGAR|nr:hypothetical protein DFP72DRAFT_1145865 [Tulosesus angulatus]
MEVDNPLLRLSCTCIEFILRNYLLIKIFIWITFDLSAPLCSVLGWLVVAMVNVSARFHNPFIPFSNLPSLLSQDAVKLTESVPARRSAGEGEVQAHGLATSKIPIATTAAIPTANRQPTRTAGISPSVTTPHLRSHNRIRSGSIKRPCIPPPNLNHVVIPLSTPTPSYSCPRRGPAQTASARQTSEPAQPPKPFPTLAQRVLAELQPRGGASNRQSKNLRTVQETLPTRSEPAPASGPVSSLTQLRGTPERSPARFKSTLPGPSPAAPEGSEALARGVPLPQLTEPTPPLTRLPLPSDGRTAPHATRPVRSGERVRAPTTVAPSPISAPAAAGPAKKKKNRANRKSQPLSTVTLDRHASWTPSTSDAVSVDSFRSAQSALSLTGLDLTEILGVDLDDTTAPAPFTKRPFLARLPGKGYSPQTIAETPETTLDFPNATSTAFPQLLNELFTVESERIRSLASHASLALGGDKLPSSTPKPGTTHHQPRLSNEDLLRSETDFLWSLGSQEYPLSPPARVVTQSSVRAKPGRILLDQSRYQDAVRRNIATHTMYRQSTYDTSVESKTGRKVEPSEESGSQKPERVTTVQDAEEVAAVQEEWARGERMAAILEKGRKIREENDKAEVEQEQRRLEGAARMAAVLRKGRRIREEGIVATLQEETSLTDERSIVAEEESDQSDKDSSFASTVSLSNIVSDSDGIWSPPPRHHSRPSRRQGGRAPWEELSSEEEEDPEFE